MNCYTKMSSASMVDEEYNQPYGWIGDDISPTGARRWIRKHKPQPHNGLCEVCKSKPGRLLLNLGEDNSREFIDWLWICRSCLYKPHNIRVNWRSPRAKEFYKKILERC